MKFEVTFARYYTYEVEAESETEAITEAHEEFESEMRKPIARTFYDDIGIKQIK